MKATEIIRGVLDLIDQVDCAQQGQLVINSDKAPAQEPTPTGSDTRFKHIFAMLSADRANPTMYDNSPTGTVASIDAVTKDASGGQSGPKHPADIRADSVAMYPGRVYGAK